jgi:hypothetical protein
MTATIVALVVAVATVIAYGVLADRFEYASVRRRQLDVFAALVAFLCFGGIVYGGVRVRLSGQAVREPPAEPTVVTPAPVGVGDLAGSEVAGSPETARPPVALLAVPDQAVVGVEGVVTLPGDEIQSAPGEDAPRPSGGDRVPVATLVTATPPLAAMATVTVPAARVPTVGPVDPTATSVMRPPTVTPVSAIATRLAPPVVPPTRTPVPPTLVVPTQAPLPLPTSTPSCGDPAQARVTMSDLSAAADRSGSDLLIRFRAQVRNDSAFPVTLAEPSVTAINKVAGAEQYGHARLSDVTIEPGAVITLDGAVTLTKLPPPFGTTELCVSFALDTCGARAERPVRQCTAVRGF